MARRHGWLALGLVIAVGGVFGCAGADEGPYDLEIRKPRRDAGVSDAAPAPPGPSASGATIPPASQLIDAHPRRIA